MEGGREGGKEGGREGGEVSGEIVLSGRRVVSGGRGRG